MGLAPVWSLFLGSGVVVCLGFCFVGVSSTTGVCSGAWGSGTGLRVSSGLRSGSQAYLQDGCSGSALGLRVRDELLGLGFRSRAQVCGSCPGFRSGVSSGFRAQGRGLGPGSGVRVSSGVQVRGLDVGFQCRVWVWG